MEERVLDVDVGAETAGSSLSVEGGAEAERGDPSAGSGQKREGEIVRRSSSSQHLHVQRDGAIWVRAFGEAPDESVPDEGTRARQAAEDLARVVDVADVRYSGEEEELGDEEAVVEKTEDRDAGEDLL